MRRTLLLGLLLSAAALVTVVVGRWLDLDLDAVALVGITAGAVVAVVPDATLGRRLGGFAVGFVASLLGYYFRAALTPDTTAGRAVFAAVVVLLCTGAVALSVGKLPLWSALLGAGTLAGAFEAAYSAAPVRVLDSSISTATALAFCIAVGFLVGAAVDSGPSASRGRRAVDPDSDDLDELMEASR